MRITTNQENQKVISEKKTSRATTLIRNMYWKDFKVWQNLRIPSLFPEIET